MRGGLIAGSAASLLLAGHVVIRLSVGPDSDWVVGLMTAVPILGLAAGLAVLAWGGLRKH